MRFSEEHYPATYIMASRSRVLYVGVTNDIRWRTWEHKNGIYDGFTKKYYVHKLVLFERHETIQEAIAREKQLKGWSRAKKIWLIGRDNPTWLDLAAAWHDDPQWYRPLELESDGGS
jgi:putative endonuclease